MPDNKTLKDAISGIFSYMGEDFSVFEKLSGNELTQVVEGSMVINATEGQIDALKAAFVANKKVWMSNRNKVKNARKGSYTSKVFGLNGTTEFVTRTSFEALVGGVSFMPGNYVVSNPTLWTSLGSYYNSDQTTPYGVVGHSCSRAQTIETKYDGVVTTESLTSISSVARHYGWDEAATKAANYGRGIPMNGNFVRDCVIFPPFYRAPKGSFYASGMEHFMSAFNHKKGRKYFSAISSAAVHQTEKVSLGLWAVGKWVDDADVGNYCEDEWARDASVNGKTLLLWNVDGTHYMNSTASALFDNVQFIQFRTSEAQLIEAIRETAGKWDDNYLLAHEANSVAKVLFGYASNPESEYHGDAFDLTTQDLTVDLDPLINNLLDNPHLYSGWNDAILCGRYADIDGENVLIPGLLETYYNNLDPILEKAHSDHAMVKGIAELPNFKEAAYKAGGDKPVIWAWYPEIKGQAKKYSEVGLKAALTHFNSDEEFEIFVDTGEVVHCNIIGYPTTGKGSWGYQQMSCLGSEKSLSRDSFQAVQSKLNELEVFEIKGFELPKSGDFQAWIDTLLALEFEILFGLPLDGGGGWHEAVVARLKNDEVNGALFAAFSGETWLNTANGAKAYSETREAMAELLFKGAGVQTLYCLMSPPSRHKAKKYKAKGLDAGEFPIPSFWQGHGHGDIVDCVVTRSPVVTMDNPYFGKGRVSKHAKSHICPQKLGFGPLVGDYDGDTSSSVVYTKHDLFEKLKRRNKMVALCHNIIVAFASQPRVDRLSFAVEDVPKDCNFKSRPLVDGEGNFIWENVSLNGEQGAMGIYAFGFDHALNTGLVTPSRVTTQCRYQSAIDLQGSITVSAWNVSSEHITVNGNEVGISEEGWEAAQAVNLDSIQRALVKDPKKMMISTDDPHWEIAVPPFIKAELQQWAVQNTFDGMKYFLAPTSVGDFVVHRDVICGWRTQYKGRNDELITQTGPGLRQINPNSVSLPITNRFLELEAGMKKKEKMRDLAWISKKKTYFGDFENVVGEYSLTHHVWRAIRATTKDETAILPTEFWCPTEMVDGDEVSKTVATLQEFTLSNVKINGYTVFGPKGMNQKIAKNFLTYLPFFNWDSKRGFVEKHLGASDQTNLTEIYAAMQTSEWWKANHIGFESDNSCYQPKWLIAEADRLESITDPIEKLELEAALFDRVNASWDRFVSAVQRLFEMIAVNASNDFCSKWVDIVPQYQPEQSSELYAALVLAHVFDDKKNQGIDVGKRGLQCGCCRKAFHRHTTPSEVDVSKQLFSELHKFLVNVDKRIDAMILSDDAHPTLKQLQVERKSRFEEAKGRGSIEGFAFNSLELRKAFRMGRDEILRLKRTRKRDLK